MSTAASPTITDVTGQAAASGTQDPPPAPPATPPADPPAADPTAAPPATPPADGTAADPPAPPADPPAGPPEHYELTLPEGTVLDQTEVDALAAIAKTKGWTNDEAQAALAEMHQQLAEQRAAYRRELEAHPEVGGPNLAAAQAHAQRALEKFLPASSPEGATFRAAMAKSGTGDYAPLVLLLARIGKAMGEDTPVNTNSGRGGGERRPTADVLFGDAVAPTS